MSSTIVILSNMRFDSPIEATSLFLARSFAAGNKVYYVEYPNTFKDYLSNRHTKYFAERKNSFLNAADALIATGNPSFKKVALPFVAPLNFLPEGKLFRLLLKINEAIIAKRLKTVLKNEGVTDFIYFNSFNFYYPGIGNMLKPSLKVYQCVDPMITPYDLKHGYVSEKQLVEESDMVICTSKALYQEKITQNPNTYFVPNAADLSHSSTALNKDTPVHSKLNDIPKPIIGYLGTIERRIDYALMKQVVELNPNKSFVFAGPVIDEHIPGWMRTTANVYLPGPVPYAEMAQMLKGFAIAVIPFKKDDVSATIFPLKLFEYLGAGKPVIVTDFNPDLKDYTHGAVNFCADAESFNKAINEVLATDNTAKQQERIAVAKKNTWDIRANQILELMRKALKK